MKLQNDNVILKVRNFLKERSLYEFVYDLYYRDKWLELKKYGHLQIFKWLSSLDIEWDNSVIEILVKKNAFSVLEFLKENGHILYVSESIFNEMC